MATPLYRVGGVDKIFIPDTGGTLAPPVSSPFNIELPSSIVVTTDATPTIVASINLNVDGAIVIVQLLTAATADGTDGAEFIFANNCNAVRNAGVSSIIFPIGPRGPGFQYGATSAGWTYEYVLFGNTVNLVITGAAFTTVTWRVGVSATWAFQ